MTKVSMSAHRWLNGREADDEVTISIVESGIAWARRTGVAHHAADAAEITLGDETTLAVRWLCGGSSVDAVMATEGAEPTCVGCRLAAQVPKCPVVYYAWGGRDELLYVGSSVNVAQRIRGHLNTTPWWHEVRRLTFDECATEFEARRLEAVAIADRPGVHNKAGRLDRPSPRADWLSSVQIGDEA